MNLWWSRKHKDIPQVFEQILSMLDTYIVGLGMDPTWGLRKHMMTFVTSLLSSILIGKSPTFVFITGFEGERRWVYSIQSLTARS